MTPQCFEREGFIGATAKKCAAPGLAGREGKVMSETGSNEVIVRIQEGLDAAARVLNPFLGADIKAESKAGGDPITEADRAVNSALHRLLLNSAEGWLSEESADNLERLAKEQVWIVDPLDGTREFVDGIPEWCVSIAWVHHGKALAGGILNPATRETFIGSVETGLLYNGNPAQPTAVDSLQGALVLASRSEVKRGEWRRFQNGCIRIQPMGSVAYKLARVAAGLADATWTLTPKHEWDVAAGVALVEAAGGCARTVTGSALRFNHESPLISGLIASGQGLSQSILPFIKRSSF
jgi:myo-inositol-1(or 4)-monophosphatase